MNTPKIESEVILFNDHKKIEFIDRVHKTEVLRERRSLLRLPLCHGETTLSAMRLRTALSILVGTKCPVRPRNGFLYSTGLWPMKVLCLRCACTGGCFVGLPGGYLPRYLADAVRPAARNDFLLRDE